MAADSVLGPALKEKVLEKARADINKALEDRRQEQERQNEQDNSGSAVQSNIGQVDVTLRWMDLVELPEELIDVIKDQVTRMSLHHNRLTGLSGLSARISECSNLRYLVLRENKIHDFPTRILTLPNLELLDLKRNRLESLPEDLDKLTHLKFLSVMQNSLKRIPVCVAKMNLLTKFEASDNPIEFPPKSEWAVSAERNGHSGVLSQEEQELLYQEETTKLKKRLLVYRKELLRKEVDGQSSDGTLDTPKVNRRKASGRFPIKPSVSGIDLKVEPVPPSPRIPKPPPLPANSYGRSSPNHAVNAVAIRPGLSPLISQNERNRSNSESGVQTSVREKRMGFHVKQLGSEKVDIEGSKRLSHLRGLSHGSALQGNVSSMPDDSPSPRSLVDSNLRRPGMTRRLSSLPEGKTKSRLEDPSSILARGLVYSLLQIFNPVKHLIVGLGSVLGSKRLNLNTSLDLAWSALEELSRKLSKSDNIAEDDDDAAARHDTTTSVQTGCKTCIEAFEQLLFALKAHTRDLVLYTSPEYVRTLMHLLYASLIEIRICCSKIAVQQTTSSMKTRSTALDREDSLDEAERPATSLRIGHSDPLHRHNGSIHEAENGKTLQNTEPAGSISRSESNVSLSNITNGPAPLALSRSSTFNSAEEEESQQFERIWVKVEHVSRITSQALQETKKLLANAKLLSGERTGEDDPVSYDQTIERCRRALEATETLRGNLKSLQVKDPALKNQFWSTVTSFTKEYVVFAAKVKEGSKTLPGFPDDLKRLLKPVQQGHKDLGRAIHASPWSQFATLSTRQSRSNSVQQSNAALVQAASAVVPAAAPHPRPIPALALQTRGNLPPPNPGDPMSSVSNVSSNGASAVSSGYVTPLPATPMSAALGPAALATLPVLLDTQLPGPSFLSNDINGGGPPSQTTASAFERTRSVSQRRAQTQQ